MNNPHSIQLLRYATLPAAIGSQLLLILILYVFFGANSRRIREGFSIYPDVV